MFKIAFRVGRKETSVRLGPYAEHFEDTDYIVGLTNENKGFAY